MVMEVSQAPLTEGMVGVPAAMEADGLGPVVSAGEEALEADPVPVGVGMEDTVVEAQEEVDPVAVEVKDTPHQTQQDRVTTPTPQLRSSVSNPT